MSPSSTTDPGLLTWATVDRRSLVKLFAGAFAAGAGLSVLIDAQARPLADLAEGDMKLVEALSDTILPDTDTPGAVRAGVPAFIATMANEWLDPADRAGLVLGLRELERDAISVSGSRFCSLSAARRLMYLLRVQEQAEAARKDAGPVPFFLLFKRLVVYGYYTSEIGASEELSLNIVHGEYNPCAPVSPNEHAFSISRTWPLFPLSNAPSF